jgi:hypothetical protein
MQIIIDFKIQHLIFEFYYLIKLILDFIKNNKKDDKMKVDF